VARSGTALRHPVTRDGAAATVRTVDDDGTGWNEVLVGGWTAEVRDAVVARIERASVGRRGRLVRTLSDPDGAPAARVEQLHELVLAAIAAETGADLDALGSQAAWACYDDVWTELTARWADGGTLRRVPLGDEPAVARLLQHLPAEVAEHGGAEVSGRAPDPLWLRGRLRVDVDGLWAYLATHEGQLPVRTRRAIDLLIARCPPPG
jgi:hypothetical protein